MSTEPPGSSARTIDLLWDKLIEPVIQRFKKMDRISQLAIASGFVALLALAVLLPVTTDRKRSGKTLSPEQRIVHGVALILELNLDEPETTAEKSVFNLLHGMTELHEEKPKRVICGRRGWVEGYVAPIDNCLVLWNSGWGEKPTTFIVTGSVAAPAPASERIEESVVEFATKGLEGS